MESNFYDKLNEKKRIWVKNVQITENHEKTHIEESYLFFLLTPFFFEFKAKKCPNVNCLKTIDFLALFVNSLENLRSGEKETAPKANYFLHIHSVHE